jgi:hypothetical protein
MHGKPALQFPAPYRALVALKESGDFLPGVEAFFRVGL